MLITLLLLIMLVVGVLIILKMGYHLSKAAIMAIVLIGLVLVYFSVANPSPDGENRGILKSVSAYFSILGQAASNFWDAGTETAHLVGNVVKVNNTEEG